MDKKKSKVFAFPKLPLKIEKSINGYEVSEKEIVSVALESAKGKTCAEDIVPYPPGIPLIAKGEVVSDEHVKYLKAIKKLKGLISLVINDESVSSLLTVTD